MCALAACQLVFSVARRHNSDTAAIQIAVVKLKSLPGAKKQGFCCFTTHTRDLSRFTRETCLLYGKKIISTLSYSRILSFFGTKSRKNAASLFALKQLLKRRK